MIRTVSMEASAKQTIHPIGAKERWYAQVKRARTVISKRGSTSDSAAQKVSTTAAERIRIVRMEESFFRRGGTCLSD